MRVWSDIIQAKQTTKQLSFNWFRSLPVYASKQTFKRNLDLSQMSSHKLSKQSSRLGLLDLSPGLSAFKAEIWFVTGKL